jgi:hypothetical protein
MSFIKKLCSSAPNKLWYGTATDVVIRYKILLCNPRGFYHISIPLSVELYPFDSIGNSFGKNKNTERYLRSAGFRFEDVFQYVPIKQYSSLNIKYNDLLMYDTEHGNGELVSKLKWDNYYKYYYKEQAVTYLGIVLTHGLRSAEEQDLKENIIKYYPEFFDTFVYPHPHWYGYLYWRLLHKIPTLQKAKGTCISAIRDPMPPKKRISMIALGLLQIFRDDKALIPFYSKHARQYVPIRGNETLT